MPLPRHLVFRRGCDCCAAVLRRTAVVMVAKATDEHDVLRSGEVGKYQPGDSTTNSISSPVLKISENGNR